MIQKKGVTASEMPKDTYAQRGVSQAVFVFVGLGIILGGLWYLYMGDAPYHPADEVSRGTIHYAYD